MLLTDPTEAGVPRIDTAYPSIPDFHFEDLTEIPICGDDDPLVVVPDDAGSRLSTRPIYWELGLPGSRPTLLARRSACDRLTAAASELPDGFGLCLLDGWRDPILQRHLFEAHYDTGDLEPGYVSDPDDPRITPPHLTGGAVDITLTWRGAPLALGTDFDAFDSVAWAQALEPTERPERNLRRMLTAVLLAQGFCGYPLEWWHFSYGDQRWAKYYGEPNSLFGPARV